ncbi:MAG: hypothetical protein KME31_29065 [Tolypothrix carrinoi HA7290-LM1]|nr:hypothetical protein [Tolypothrix carrinoi HA7290-LM1]
MGIAHGVRVISQGETLCERASGSYDSRVDKAAYVRKLPPPNVPPHN